ncbi:PTS system lactose-specific transporter subunit IIBC [Streptococcus pneumoniae]|nr:PTS system lactose-specific transporter subunit IIBC [Streptococcus pneumoniae]
MDKLIIFIEKGKPFFEKLSRNIYLRAIKDGFISSMPAVLFSSIFILIAAVPNIFGFKWSDEQLAFILKPYNYSMGILALLVAGTTAKSLTDSVNTRSMEKTNQINYMSTFLAAVVGLLILAPAPIGIVMGTALAPLSFVLAITLIIIDTLIYYPFVKVYDHQILEEERKGNSSSELKEKVAANFNTVKADAILEKAGVDAAQNTITEETNVLVLCAGGGTSGLLANALNKAAAEYNVPVKAAAGGYGAHREMLPEFDLVILAPQVASNFEDMKAETDKLGIKLAKTEGAQYIKLTRDGKGALAFVQEQFD